MRKEYDFSKAKRNPYAKRLKQSVTMRLDKVTVDCALTGRRPSMQWRPSRSGAA
jgi:hypothetical protein